MSIVALQASIAQQILNGSIKNFTCQYGQKLSLSHANAALSKVKVIEFGIKVYRQFSSVCHNYTLNRNQCINIWTQAKLKLYFPPQIQNYFMKTNSDTQRERDIDTYT